MSKLFMMYTDLKKQNPDILFLFKSGIFYIALDKDAIQLSELLSLKLTSLNDTVLKCGFPCKSLDKYLNLFHALNLKIKIIEPDKNISYGLKEYEQDKSVSELLEFINHISIESLSVGEAYKTLEVLKQKANSISNKN